MSAVTIIASIIAWPQTLFVSFSAPIFHPIPGDFCLWNWPPDQDKIMKNASELVQGTLIPATSRGGIPAQSHPWGPGRRK